MFSPFILPLPCARSQCLSKWYHVGAAKAGLASSYDDACEHVYGMSYKAWKQTHQAKASDEQLRRMEETKALHAKHETPPPVAPAPAPAPAPAAPPPPPSTAASGGMSNVCCVPEDELVPVNGGEQQTCAKPPMVVPPSAPVAVRLGVLTVSDRASKGEYADLSGPEIESAMNGFAATPAGLATWKPLEVTRRAVVADEAAEITKALTSWSDEGGSVCNLILTTGGTGLAPRDVTPEATSAVLDRSAPGIVELLLRSAIQHEPLAALSRSAAGVRGKTLIVNLPGRPKAVRENLAVLMPLLGHALKELE